ncbi:MAG: protein-L-isoaspartate O-methyltransferase [Rhizobiaceae bacterium]|nr:protein-L-isoaspartate O-methyltransferase [Rhizobiaceae bacterium]MCV0409080.1 protein-L-isoaspartate O-methyltransferase [Rhizobiaceae bacterium]
MEPDYAALRAKMVDSQVRTTDVTDHAIVSALLSVPREEFVPATRRALAYIDEDLLLTPAAGANPARWLMEPSPFAKLLQLARITPDSVVLDVGCATGYSAAVLSRIAQSVIAVEQDEALAQLATSTLTGLGYDNAVVVTGPLAEGYPSEAPFDVILLEGAVETIPQALLDQLKDGGRLVAAEGTGNAAVAKAWIRDGASISAVRGFNAAVKPLPGFEKAAEFQF